MRCSLVLSVLRATSGLRPKLRPKMMLSPAPCRRAPGQSLSIALLALCITFLQPALANPTLPVTVTPAPAIQWTAQSGLRNQAHDALAALQHASSHGLPENRYALDQLNTLALDLHSSDNELVFNELLTAALETYTLDLVRGLQPSAFKDRRDPKHRRNSPHTVASQLQAGVLKGLHRAIKTNRLAKFMRSIEPKHADYKALQSALVDYKTLVARGGWPQVPRSKNGAALRVGEHHPRVVNLRARLKVIDNTVELSPSGNPERYDEALKQAVMRFQISHGLKGDGVVGKNTRAALNVSAEQRVQQIELNLDRWRLMPNVMPANHVWVNVPQYEMKLQLDRKEVLDMRVVVGKTRSPTPMMEDRLEHIVFSPYWYPTRKISAGEILPSVQKDPNYLIKRRFEVLENDKPIDASGIDWQQVTPQNMNYRFRQRPGKGNSLGDVKFMFPNNYAVYMHDTNAKSLFDKSMRAFSHGCVRLEDPESLATALLEWDKGWKRQKVSRAMASGRQKYVKLEQTVPVYLVYFTTTVKDGVVKFHDDLYGHDKRHSSARMAQQHQELQGKGNTRVAQIIQRYLDPQRFNAAFPSVSTSASVSQELSQEQNNARTKKTANALASAL